jgi:hypothetical protein
MQHVNFCRLYMYDIFEQYLVRVAISHVLRNSPPPIYQSSYSEKQIVCISCVL